MKAAEIIVLVCVLTAKHIFAQEERCSALPEKLQNEITLTQLNEQIKLTFAKEETCTLTIKSYEKLAFRMTVLEYKIDPSENCDTNFVKAAGVQKDLDAKPELKVCKPQDVAAASAMSQENILYVKVKATPGQQPKDKTVTLNFKSLNGPECGPSVINLASAVQTIKLPASDKTFNTNTECSITVTGIRKRNFNMTIPQITFKGGDTCDTDYVVAAAKMNDLSDKTKRKCGTSPVNTPVTSDAGTLYLQVVTATQDSKDVTFEFKTAYPECGQADFKLVNDSLDLKLPAMGYSFEDSTLCNIKVSSTENKQFEATITEIKFPSNCNENYVAVSATENGLSDTKMHHCGTTSVTTPIKSENGFMYLRIATTDVTNKPTVTIHFQSGSGKPAPYGLVAIFVFTLVFATL